MPQFCQCGAQAGYLHAYTCPYPCYGNSEERAERWNVAQDEIIKGLRDFQPDISVQDAMTPTGYMPKGA